MQDYQGYFKDGERKAIYNSAETLRDKILIRLLWVTGRRINEILNIKVHEIDFNLKQVTIHVEKKTKKIGVDELGNSIRGKFDKLSLSYLDDFTINLLKYYIKSFNITDNMYLFLSDFKSDKPITRQRAFQIVRRLCEKAGVHKVGDTLPHPHHFRHTFAIDMARKMKSPEDVRKLQMALDHSSLSVTERYLKFSNEEIRGLVNNIGD